MFLNKYLRSLGLLAVVPGMMLGGCAGTGGSTGGSANEGPITIASQGSFFVGGRQVTAAGKFDATASPNPPTAGQTYWVDQMYVQYQIPVNARKYPLIFVHGGSGTGRVWETTPDGREGFQTIFLRRGFPVYIVDFPRRGRAGYPSFGGPFGPLDDKQQIVANRTGQAGREYAWSRWRLGPKYPDVFPVQAFPMNAVDSFLQHLVPTVSDNAEIISGALVKLLDKIGPAVVVTHSQSGLFGWLAGARSPNVKGIVAYEPGFVFKQGEVPPPIPMYKGSQPSGTPVTPSEFAKLATIPLQVVYGDNIPRQPIPDLIADGRRAQVVTSVMFADALNKQGGQASVLHLPDVGLRGNSHFMFSDLNNIQVADELSKFLNAKGLDGR
jgi:pimeloyl-ACP methyl ester carboxylesterase